MDIGPDKSKFWHSIWRECGREHTGIMKIVPLKCTIVSGDLTFKSAEHLYQYEFCMHCERPDLAQEVIKAQGPKFAKQIAAELKSQIPPETLADWCTARLIVMQDVLKLKWNSCSKFRHALMATIGMVVAEATQDSFWGVGVAPNLAQETRRDKFLGQNHLGSLLMGLRGTMLPHENLNLSMLLSSHPLQCPETYQLIVSQI